jgi:hypothetical protein
MFAVSEEGIAMSPREWLLAKKGYARGDERSSR